MKKRVFISFKSEDKQQVWGLRLLAANPDFDIEFFDESVRTPIDSQNSTYIRQKIREKINRTSITICMIGINTYKSEWVRWELEESINKGNQIIAMGLKGIQQATFPEPIQRLGLTVYSWDHDYLFRLIKES
jgi:hypothetical protein